MSTYKKVTLLSVTISIIVGSITILITTGSLPFRAGKFINRLEVVEKKVDKIDVLVEDVAYIRGWIEAQDKEK